MPQSSLIGAAAFGVSLVAASTSPWAAGPSVAPATDTPWIVLAASESHSGHAMATDMDGPIAVESAWARETAASAKVGGVFVMLANHGDTPDRLISGASEAASRVELHTHIMEGEVMKMRQIEAIDLPAGETVALEPGGLHIMLIDLVAPLQEDATIPLTLTFEQAGDVELEVQIKDIKHGTGGGHGGHDMKHGN